MTVTAGDGWTKGSKADAQRRADQVGAFSRELAELEREGVVALSPDQRAAIQRHHAGLLASLARQYDVDRTEPQRQMALGMRVASLLAAVTLSAGVVLFFYRVWGILTTPAQIAALVAMPLLLLAGVEIAARLEPTRYVASILAIIAAASFALDVNVVGVIFNMTPAPTILLAWAAFALAVAYAYDLKLLLAAGLAAAMGYLLAVVAAATGIDWSVSITRPEPLLLAGPCAVAVSFRRFATRPEGFDGTWRLVGTSALLLPLVFLSTWPEVFSYRLLPTTALHAVYDTAGFVLPAGAIYWGIRRRWTDVVNASAGFLVLFTYAKFFDWWWEVLPRYVFFLVLGGLAVATMLVLARLRRRVREV
jgi:uncharacterized membrane protein